MYENIISFFYIFSLLLEIYVWLEQNQVGESSNAYTRAAIHIYPTPPLGQDMTQGQFLSGV